MSEDFELTGIPWIPFAAKRFLDTLIKPGWKVFEYGSGNSTYYFARAGCDVISVEDKLEWFETLVGSGAHTGRGSVILRYVPLESEIFGTDVADPTHYYEPPGDGNYRKYASEIDVYPINHFDFVFVDGVARPSCLLHAHDKVRPGGYLLLDNSERGYYLTQTYKLFKSWERYDFWGHGPINNYKWNCTIYRRPPRRD